MPALLRPRHPSCLLIGIVTRPAVVGPEKIWQPQITLCLAPMIFAATPGHQPRLRASASTPRLVAAEQQKLRGPFALGADAKGDCCRPDNRPAVALFGRFDLLF